MRTRVIKVHSPAEVAPAARKAAVAVRAGKLVGYATETVYGIAALASRAETMARLRELKSRPDRPFTVHLGRPEDVGRYVRKPPRPARLLMEKGWPGPITLLLRVGRRLVDKKLQAAGLRGVLCKDGWIALRCPDAPVAAAMLSAAGMPVVSPSANLADAPSPTTAAEVLAGLDGKIDLLIDEGPTRYRRDSTIVRVDGDGWDIVRRGVYDGRAIRRLMRRTLLFVCTGNTCRSALAEGLAKKMLADKLGCDVADLRKQDVDVQSAGVFTSSSNPATPEMILTADSMGADISAHRSQKLAGELIRAADMVFCMTDFHVEAARRLMPSASEKIRKLGCDDIPDPIGGGADVYRKTAMKIKRALSAVLREVQLL